MKQPKRYVVSFATLEESLAALARLPRVLKEAHQRWTRVRFVVEEAPDQRSIPQNALQWRWCSDAAKQGDQSAEDYQAYCKLHFGIPILRRDSVEYRDAYDRIIKPLPYEQKLELQKAPFEWPVTRAMTKKQLTEYLDLVWQHFTGLGFQLTDPALRGMDDWRQVA